jgi:hypothetical protein
MKTTRSMRSASMMSFAVLLAVATGGCGSDGPKTQLVAVAPIEAGATCQRGGITVTSGTDENRDGVLDAEEVGSTQTVCNGPQADPASVVNTTILAEGSDECPLGGSLVSSGLDNGDGGGTAGNGTLEAGEVDATVAICSGEPVGDYDLTPPAGAAGTSAITLNGGSATSGGSGAAAGNLTLGDPSAGFPSSYAIFTTGAVDTTHTVPVVTPDFGADPFVVAGSMNVVSAPAPAACANNVVYLDGSVTPNKLVRCHTAAANFYTAITGVNVPVGTTLTFDVTPDLELSDDLVVAGTLTSLPSGGNVRPGVTIAARNVSIAATGVIALQAVPGSASGQGGALTLTAAGTLVNLGAINTQGAVHMAVVSAGRNVTLTADILHNGGPINAAGATLTSTNGSAGGVVSLTATNALHNVGAISTIGGGGNGGGAGGAITLALNGAHRVGPARRLVSTGALSTNGGLCDNAAATAGAGGAVTISATNARIRHSAAITTTGGSSDLAATTCTGGAGGQVQFVASSPDAGWDDVSMIDVGGNITLTGGSGGTAGGVSGNLVVSARRARGGLARMLGYSTLSLVGGAGAGIAGSGGGAGTVVHSTTTAAIFGFFPTFIPEQIHIHPLVNAVGGAASSFGTAGSGGSILISYTFAGANTVTGASDEPGLLLAGGANLSSGGGLGAGAAGTFTYTSFGDVVLSGPITASGGSGFGSTVGGTLSVVTTGDIVASGALNVDGGDASLVAGSQGGSVTLVGAHVTLSGAVSARGGDAASARPGDGGSVEVQSVDAPSSVTGVIDVTAGTATNPDGLNSAALPGTVVIDGVGI